eukprot:TRINITY_DN4352_c0_g1_i3.p1 TRINITY_DN4352_c0_g1~~TRINITY_DN4352_c0_g1_i3.p1  ORF type:complete len:293 (-),score=73.70 TRINITY_DN4352_c0_g1_i3:344-1135(-)
MSSLEEWVKMDSLFALFKRCDVDDSGTLSRGELRSALVSCGMRSADVDTIYKAMDSNHDGQINYKEFVSWLHKGSAEADRLVKPIAGIGSGPKSPEEALMELMESVNEMKDAPPPEGSKRAPTLKDVFKKLDTNGSGKISMSELKAAMKSVVGYDIDADMLKDVFAMIDTQKGKKKKLKRLSEEEQQEVIEAAIEKGIEPPRFQHGIAEGDISAFLRVPHERVMYSGNDEKKRGKIVYDPHFEPSRDYEITFKEFKAAFDAAF